MNALQDRIWGTKFGWLIFEGDKTTTRILKTLRYFFSGDSTRWFKLPKEVVVRQWEEFR